MAWEKILPLNPYLRPNSKTTLESNLVVVAINGFNAICAFTEFLRGSFKAILKLP
jgi:hypothetical protein